MSPSSQSTPPSSLFPALSEALQNELDVLTQSPRTVILFSGERIGTFAEQHYYRFEIPEHLVLNHVSRARFSFGTSQPLICDGVMVALENQYLTVALPFDFGSMIPETTCSWDFAPFFKPVIESLATMNSDAVLPQLVLGPGAESNMHAVSFEPVAAPDTPQDQVIALKKIVQNRVSLLWGPIRSGKTRLLAHVAAAYVQAGKRVLFVDTVNARVDDLLLQSIEAGKQLGVDCAATAVSLGLPALENFEKLSAISFEQQIASLKAEKKRSFSERVGLLETYWSIRIKQILHEEYTGRLNEMRERISEKKKQIEQLTAELGPLKEAVHRIQNASMMDRLKKGFGKDDLAQAQKKLDEKQSAIKRLQSMLTPLTRESLRVEANNPLAGEEQQQFNLALKRIDELGGIEKVQAAVDEYTHVNEESLLDSRKLIGTTLVTALTDPRLQQSQFDMVMVDDAEAIPIPFLVALAKLSREKMVISGDPYQLGPESSSASQAAQQWLRRDIFLHLAATDQLNRLFDFTDQNSQWCILLSSHFASTPKLSLFVGSMLFDDKINVFASPKAKGRIFFVDTSSLHSHAKQYLGRKKILPVNDLQTRKTLELVKHALMESGRTATDVGVILPFAGPTLFTKLQLRMNGIRNIEVGPPSAFRGRRKKAVVFDTVMAGVDHTMRQMDDKKIGEHEIVRLLNTVFSCVDEDLYVLVDVNHLQAVYKDRLLTRFLILLKGQSDPGANFARSAKEFDELDWDKRRHLLSFSGEALATGSSPRQPNALAEDAEFAIQMKLMAKREGVKVEGGKNYERETFIAVHRLLGLLADVNLLSQYTGGDVLFHQSYATEQAAASLPVTIALSEKEFRSAMELWNLMIYEMSGGHKPDSSYFKNAPETRTRSDINALKSFYSTDVDAVIEEGKQKLAVAVSKVFQETLGKPQPGSPQEWAMGYLNFLSKMESYLSWISEQLRK
jgi:KaiC/GvpD/RAD55 family RecA-like ATPase